MEFKSKLYSQHSPLPSTCRDASAPSSLCCSSKGDGSGGDGCGGVGDGGFDWATMGGDAGSNAGSDACAEAGSDGVLPMKNQQSNICNTEAEVKTLVFWKYKRKQLVFVMQSNLSAYGTYWSQYQQ